jgi:hypothetical protein
MKKYTWLNNIINVFLRHLDLLTLNIILIVYFKIGVTCEYFIIMMLIAITNGISVKYRKLHEK